MMTVGNIVYVIDSVGAPVGLSRGSSHKIKSIKDDSFLYLEGWAGAPFNIHRFTLVPPTTRIRYSW